MNNLGWKHKRGGATPSQKEKVGKVMREFKEGELHSGKSEKIVKDPKQAIAIALSEAGMSKKITGGGVGDNVLIMDEKSLMNNKAGVIVGEDGNFWLVKTLNGTGLVKKGKVKVIKEFATGGSIGFIPMDIEEKFALLAKWGGMNIREVIEYFNAMIDAGITDADLQIMPTKNTRFQRERSVEQKIKEIWGKVEPKHKGELKGNRYYSMFKELISRNFIYEGLLANFKSFRKNQNFATGGGVGKKEKVYQESKWLTKEQWEKWNDYVKTGKIYGKKENNIFTVARWVGVPVAKINAYEIEQRAKRMATGGGVREISTNELDKVREKVNNFLNPLGYIARVESLANEIHIEPDTRKVGNNRKDFFDGMQIIRFSDGTYEVSEYQAGENENELFVYKETKSLTTALKDLIKGNKRKPIKKYAKGGGIDKERLDAILERRTEINSYLNKKYGRSRGKNKAEKDEIDALSKEYRKLGEEYLELNGGYNEYAKGGGVGNGMLNFVLNEMSSGFIANNSNASTYEETGAIRIKMIKILQNEGDRNYSLKGAVQLVKEAEMSKNEYSKGGGIGLSHNAEKYLGFMREMYPKTMDIDTTTPSKDVNKAIAELELEGLIKRLSYNRGFAEYGVKNMNYENGGIAEFNDLNIPVIRTQFEEEEFEFEDGGALYKRTKKTPDGTIVGKVVYNDFWKTYQVDIDGVVYEEFKTKEEAINNLKSAGFDKMAKGGNITQENREMLLSQVKEIKHHAEEISSKIYKGSKIEAWVVAKMERASTDLSDVTHYLDGRTKMANGGGVGFRNIDKIKSNIGEVIFNHITSLTKPQLEKQLSELKSELKIADKNSQRYTKLKDEEWYILYRLERVDEFQYAQGGTTDLNDMDIPVIRTQFEEEEFEFEKGGEVSPEERNESLKNYPKLKF